MEKTKVGQYLFGMNRRQCLNRLEFHNQGFFNEQVTTKPFVEANTPELYWHRNLTFHR